MQLIRSGRFTASLQRLQQLDAELFVTVAADLQYLIKSGRDAELPQVRFGLAQSRYAKIMGEVRSHIPGRPEFVRTIFVMPEDASFCVFLLLGDKNSQSAEAATGNDWYLRAIPLADQLWEEISASGNLP